MAWELIPKLTVIFRQLAKRSSFLACWRLADVAQEAKGISSSVVVDYRYVSITPVLSKVFDKAVARKLSNSLAGNSLLSPSHSRIVETWAQLMLCLHCLTTYRLRWTEDWRKELFSLRSHLHLIGLAIAVCCIS